MNYQDMNIKNPTFGGFKPDAMSRIAKTLGYEGEMSGFQQYLDQNPDKRTQMDQFKQAAMMMARGGSVQKFQVGGTPSTIEEQKKQFNQQNQNFANKFVTDQMKTLDNFAATRQQNPLSGVGVNNANALMAQANNNNNVVQQQNAVQTTGATGNAQQNINQGG